MNTTLNLVESFVLVSLVTLAIFWYVWANSKLKKVATEAPLPPGPRGLPIVGYLPFLGTNLQQSFAQLANTYGPIYKLWLGNKLCVVINSPPLVKEVVRDQDATFANRDVPIAALALTYGGVGIVWSPFGANWRLLRKVFVRDMMSNASLDACYDLRKDEVLKTIKQVGLKIGSPIDVGEIMFMTELNVITSLLWGGGSSSMTEGVKAEFREVISKSTELLGKPNVSDFFPVLARFDIQGVEKEMKRLALCIDQILDSVINVKRMKGGSGEGDRGFENRKRKDLLQVLLEHNEQEDTSTHITVTQIKALLMDIVVGGTDTTTTMAEWVMVEMMRNPDMMKKAQEEIAQAVGINNIVEESHLPKLQYLDAVIKETFRLYPAVPLLVPKSPSVSCVVGGYTIPKGTRVLINVWAMHRDPQVWDNPSEFKPERFLNDDTSKWDYTGNNFQYLPFGSGRRICPGINLAEKMLMYVLASLLHAFDWQLPKGEELDLSETIGIVMKKRTPLIAIPSKRSYNSDLYA